MFIILESGRQSGATTYFVNKITDDLENGLTVGIIGDFDFTDRNIKFKGKGKVVNYLHQSKIPIYEINSVDKLYIQDIDKVSGDLLDSITCRHDVVLCDKLRDKDFSEIDYNVARELRYKDNKFTLEEAKYILENVNMVSVEKLKNRNITRKDIQFLKIDNSFNFIKRLLWFKGDNKNLY